MNAVYLMIVLLSLSTLPVVFANQHGNANTPMSDYVFALDNLLHQQYHDTFWELIQSRAWTKPSMYPQIKNLCNHWNRISPIVDWPNANSYNRLCSIYEKVHNKYYYALVK